MLENIFPSLFNKIKEPGCEKCVHGIIRIPKEPLGWDSEPCSCLVEFESLEYSQELLKWSNMSHAEWKMYDIKNWKEPAAINFDILKNLITSDDLSKNWLFLYGSPGTGKSYAAAIACQIALLQEKSVYFTTVADLLEELRPNELDITKPKTTLYCAKKTEVLVLDDIGHEKSSEWVRTQLYMIINHRWKNSLCTIFTSNFPIEHLKDTVSDAVYSRVKGASLEIVLKGKDKRQK